MGRRRLHTRAGYDGPNTTIDSREDAVHFCPHSAIVVISAAPDPDTVSRLSNTVQWEAVGTPEANACVA